MRTNADHPQHTKLSSFIVMLGPTNIMVKHQIKRACLDDETDHITRTGTSIIIEPKANV